MRNDAHKTEWIAAPRAVLLLVVLAGAAPAQAQVSTSFQLREHAFNAGGRPDQGAIAQSASFRVSLDAVGDTVSLTGLSSASFAMDVGFVAPYPPPQEVTGLGFSDDQTIFWDPEGSTGSYGVYRSLLNTLPGQAYGSCFQSELTDETTTDGTVPPAGHAYFYLVTAENLLAEEGTKGFNSAGAERANLLSCP